MLQAVDTYITPSMTSGVACCPRLVSRSANQARPSCFALSALIFDERAEALLAVGSAVAQPVRGVPVGVLHPRGIDLGRRLRRPGLSEADGAEEEQCRSRDGRSRRASPTTAERRADAMTIAAGTAQVRFGEPVHERFHGHSHRHRQISVIVGGHAERMSAHVLAHEDRRISPLTRSPEQGIAWCVEMGCGRRLELEKRAWRTGPGYANAGRRSRPRCTRRVAGSADALTPKPSALTNASIVRLTASTSPSMRSNPRATAVSTSSVSR